MQCGFRFKILLFQQVYVFQLRLAYLIYKPYKAQKTFMAFEAYKVFVHLRVNPFQK